jgi:hypothetical protein
VSDGAILPDGGDPAAAEEVLRQAQTLIAAQLDFAKAVDAKLSALLRAALSLTVASLGGAAFALSDGAWLPVWGALGLAAMGAVLALAAIQAFWALRGAGMGAPAIPADALIARGVHELPARQAYLAIAFDLARVGKKNDDVARTVTRQMRLAFTLAVCAPAFGVAVASSAAMMDTRAAVLAWLMLLGSAAALRGMFRLFSGAGL